MVFDLQQKAMIIVVGSTFLMSFFFFFGKDFVKDRADERVWVWLKLLERIITISTQRAGEYLQYALNGVSGILFTIVFELTE